MQDMARSDTVMCLLIFSWQDSHKINQEENYKALSEKRKKIKMLRTKDEFVHNYVIGGNKRGKKPSLFESNGHLV